MAPAWSGDLRRMLHRAYARAAQVVRSSPVIYRALFGHWPAPALEGQLWDWTTLVLASALRREVGLGATVLDVGTGPAGVLAIYAKHRLGCGRACGVDHLPELLPSAVATAERCRVRVEFSSGSLFSSVDGRFDIIVFNAPYIAAAEGRRLGVLRSRSDEQRWAGGATGREIIERFLRDAPVYLTPSGRILVGVNHFHLPAEAVRRAAEEAGLVLDARIVHRLTRACAYVLHPQRATGQAETTDS